MSTVQEIIDWVDRKYPDHGETDANLIKDLNDMHKEVFTKISRVKHDQEIWSFQTVTDPEPLPSYDLADDCTIDLITSVKVSKSASPSTVDDYYTYDYAGLNDDIDVGGYYFDGGKNQDTGVNKIGLSYNGDIIQVPDLEVRVYYNKRPNELTSVSDTPNLNPDYHTLLKYALTSSVASQGHNPDTEIADFYQKKFDEFFKDIQEDISGRYNQNPNRTNQADEWW
jgi:hypothetical protein